MQLLDIVTKDSTDRSVVIRIIDSSGGTPETGVEHNTSGIDLWYRREGAAKVSITEAALADLTTAHTDGGIEHIGDGAYRLDLPDAAFATGANYVDVGGTVTGMIVIGGRVRLVDFDIESATVDVGQWKGSVPADLADTDKVPVSVQHMAANTITAAAAAADFGAELAALVETYIVNEGDATAVMQAIADVIAQDWIAGDATPLAIVAALKADAEWSNLTTIAGYIDTEVAAIKAVTDNLPDSGALSSLATASALSTVDTVVDAIKAITDAIGATAAARLALTMSNSPTGTVDTATNGHTPSATEFQADDITEDNDDHYNGRVVLFTSGNLAGQATSVSDYAAVNGIGQFTVVALSEAPANDDTFIIL